MPRFRRNILAKKTWSSLLNHRRVLSVDSTHLRSRRLHGLVAQAEKTEPGKVRFSRLPSPRLHAENAGAPRALLAAMDSRDRGLGQATFRDFAEFMDGESRGAAYLRTSEGRGASPKLGGLEEKVGHYEAWGGILASRVRAARGSAKRATTDVVRAIECKTGCNRARKKWTALVGCHHGVFQPKGSSMSPSARLSPPPPHAFQT